MHFYENIAPWYDLLYGKRDYEGACRFFRDIFKKHGNVKKVLDIGCGTGSHAKHLAEMGYTVTGIDKSRNMIAEARKKVPKARFVKSTIMDFQTEERFDAALAIFTVINSCTSSEKLQAMFRKVYTLLEPGGLFLFDSGLSVKNVLNKNTMHLMGSDGKRSAFLMFKMIPVDKREFLLSSILFKKEGKQLDMGIHDDEHIGLFSMGELKSSLKKAGFSFHIYESFRMKKYSRFRKQYGFPIFVAKKN